MHRLPFDRCQVERSTVMVSASAPTADYPTASVRRAFSAYLLRALLVLGLIFYAWVMGDLVLNPLAPGIGPGGSIAERYVDALVGTGVIVVGAFIILRVPGNSVGPLVTFLGLGV